MPDPECRTSTRNTEPRNWGTTSSRPARLNRSSRRSASTERAPVRSAARRVPPGGSRTQRATASAVTTQVAASAVNTAGIPPKPATEPWAIGGSATAASAAPIGTEVCRSAIARPRRPLGNQVSTARPLAAFTEAPEAPASSSSPPAAIGSVTSAAAPSAAPAPSSPTVITGRSPNRSAALPQAIRVATRPTEITPIRVPTPASESPKYARRSGATAASPRKYVAVAPCAALPTASTTHR
jgi:hypothetical protein